MKVCQQIFTLKLIVALLISASSGVYCKTNGSFLNKRGLEQNKSYAFAEHNLNLFILDATKEGANLLDGFEVAYTSCLSSDFILKEVSFSFYPLCKIDVFSLFVKEIVLSFLFPFHDFY